MLWQVYTKGSPEKRAVLAACFERLQKVQAKSIAASGPVNWYGDEDIRCLLSNRIPTVLAVERELREHPEGPYLSALVHIVKAIGSSRVSRQLPELLERTKSVESKREILKAMAEVRDPVSLAALERFLKEAGPGTPEVLIVEAAEGLGQTRGEEYLPLLRRVASAARPGPESLRIAGSRYRCGDSDMVAPILSALRDDKSDLEVQLWSIRFLAENSISDAVPVLAELAVDGRSKQLSTEALNALIQVTGHAQPPASDTVEPERTQPLQGISEQGQPGEEPALPSEEPKELSQKERAQLVQAIMKWWQEHPEARPQPRKSPTRERQFQAMGEGVPH